MTTPQAVALVRSGCGWLAVCDDGRIWCTKRDECAGPHDPVPVEPRRRSLVDDGPCTCPGGPRRWDASHAGKTCGTCNRLPAATNG